MANTDLLLSLQEGAARKSRERYGGIYSLAPQVLFKRKYVL